MKFSAHKLLKSQEGFRPNISPTDDDIKYLKSVRKIVRQALREAFADISIALFLDSANRWQIINEQLPASILKSLRNLPAEQKSALKKLKPKFASQGSFIYQTMNTPCHQPPQQMDLDDGIYLPIEILREGPILGKNLFFQIVDNALIKLAKIHGWTFVGDKETCVRVIVRKDMHLDVPLYAIPYKQYVALKANLSENTSMPVDDSKRYLSSDDVYLAVRKKEHWIKSDPAKISRWFLESVKIHGETLRRVCRYLKAWRDYTFSDGGPSSITLMACVVESFDNAGKRFKDDSEALFFCTERLPSQLSAGVINPVDETEPDLFPKASMTESEKEQIIAAAKKLKVQVKLALLQASDKQEVVQYFINCFGIRVPNRPELIMSASVATVMSKPAIPQPQPGVPNMKAG